MESKRKCKTCKFFYFELSSAPKQGTCKRFPPVQDEWTNVREEDIACGEYK